MRFKAAALLLLLSTPLSASVTIEWSLDDVAYSGAYEVNNAYQRGGDDSAIAAIEGCHAGVADPTEFNMVTARCLAMDFTGTLLSFKHAKENGTTVPAFFNGDDGSFIQRGTLYLLLLSPGTVSSIMQIIKENVAIAVPSLGPDLFPNRYP